MIMNIKQRKIQIEPKTKLNYNIYNINGYKIKIVQIMVRNCYTIIL